MNEAERSEEIIETKAKGRWSKLNGLPKFHLIPGAPSGVVAMITLSRKGQTCNKCSRVFENDDEIIWFCGREWLGTRKHGQWCFSCLI